MDNHEHDTVFRRHVKSGRSGLYNPGPSLGSQPLSNELSYVRALQNDLMLEEFPEGPYGAPEPATLGKSSPWKVGQAVISPHWDQNPMESNRKRPAEERPFESRSVGSIEGQN